MIKNIIFDLGDVLVDFDPLRVMREMGLDEAGVESVAEHTVFGPHWKELDRGVLDKSEVFGKMISEAPAEYKASVSDFLNNQVLKTVKSFDYARKWVGSLKEKGLKIYLLTNYPEWMFDYHYKNVFTFTDFVDGKVVSGVVKLIKPDEGIYKTLLEKYNLTAEECIFIDDRSENVEAANKLGIKGICFTKQKTVDEDIKKIIQQSE